MDHVVIIAILWVGLLGSGLVAGVFYAFSTFVVKALRRLPAEQGVAAMQSINVAVINPFFLGVFMGTAAASAAAVLIALARWQSSGARWMFLGGLLYLFGTFGVTMAFNVPLNNSLAVVAPTDADAADAWDDYGRRWTHWNHLRTAAALAATAAFVLAMRH